MTTTKSEVSPIDQYRTFLKLPAKTKFDKVCEILDFYIAGEETNKQLLFFLFLGDYHRDLKTLVLYRGDPGSGKSYVVDKVLKLFPAEDVFKFDSATGKALNYAEEQLAGVKIIFLKEMSVKDKEIIIDYLKALFDEGEKIHLETVKDEEEKGYTVLTHFQKRMGVVTTFSFETIQADIVNRSWVLIPDERHIQTEKVINFTLDNEELLIDRSIKEAKVENKCFFIGQCIKCLDFDYEVYISYSTHLKEIFPCKSVSERRDVNKLIHLIKIITLWNQFNRKSVEIGSKRFLFAEYEDLEMALAISQKLFIDLVLQIDEVKRLILDYCREIEVVEVMPLVKREAQKNLDGMLELEFEEVNPIENKPVEVKKYTVTEVYEALRSEIGVKRRTVYRKMNDLFYEGYLLKEKNGSKYEYSKIKDYNVIEALDLKNKKEEITLFVNQLYEFYKNKNKELLEGVYDLSKEERKGN